MTPFPALRPHRRLGRAARPLRGARPRASTCATLSPATRARFERFSVEAPEVFADLSKNLLDAATLHFLADLARECGVEAQRDAMFAGEPINVTEGRAVLHTAAARAAAAAAPHSARGARACSTRCSPSPTTVRARADAGAHARDIVNIGIGGSDLGPQMAVARAGARSRTRGSRCHFVSNVDGHDIASVLRRARPRRDALHRRQQDLHDPGDDGQRGDGEARGSWPAAATRIARHFVAATTQRRGGGALRHRAAPSASGTGSAAATRCGRRSACRSRSRSARRRFRELLAGAHAMDEHFAQRAGREEPADAARPARRLVPQLPRLHEPLRRALPPRRCSGCPPTCSSSRWKATASASTATARALPYRAPARSSGASPAPTRQHAYFQMLHQGSDVVPVEFILVRDAERGPAASAEAHRCASTACCSPTAWRRRRR